MEKEDGSLPPDDVNSSVFGSDTLMFMWDDLVGAELTEEQCLQLLSEIVKCCVKVTAKGILKRRLNEDLVKAYNSMPLRHRVVK